MGIMKSVRSTFGVVSFAWARIPLSSSLNSCFDSFDHIGRDLYSCARANSAFVCAGVRSPLLSADSIWVAIILYVSTGSFGLWGAGPKTNFPFTW